MTKRNSTITRRKFLKGSAALASIAILPSTSCSILQGNSLRMAHIGVGAMGAEDVMALASHQKVDVVALCDVDSENLAAAKLLHPSARVFSDYRRLFDEMASGIDAVSVSTPDHTHAPASIMAMNLGKHVYCQKPLTHHVSESRAMNRLASEKGLITQMGIQVHSFYDYKLATLLIRSGIIGKVGTIRAWSPKEWGTDLPEPTGSEPIPPTLDWNLWLGTAAERSFNNGYYHPAEWRRLLDFGSGTLGDMGVHIFDTPYNALELDVPTTITNSCRPPTGFGFPTKNVVEYEFAGNERTTGTLKWIWYDGMGAPDSHEDLMLPNGDPLPEQGAMFVGEKGRLLLPHFMEAPKLIVAGNYEEIASSGIDISELGPPNRDYELENPRHYHQFVDACLGKGECSTPFSYAARLSETILLGTIAGRFPDQTLHWDSDNASFSESEANQFLDAPYRDF